ncbi:hypothetical protein UCDDA912_g06291 [Diaporthe ampelina]|uniref:Uncharacterized protein n=1 Tax=Diaporthe ampelina TaxID=1214573 RepID=A0A0G2FGV0_9PEZI|nr:hypothetical protein UCDDA912_g06291 [Diaporthe ampelina]
MATATRPPEATPGDEQASIQGTTPEQQASIRLVFQSELGIANVQLIKVESTVLYNALTIERHADIDAQDDGSFHSEVVKNAIHLLQRFHRCAPLYLKMDAGHTKRNSNFFAKEIFCRTFCSDIEGFDNKDNPRAWIDVFHFFQAMKRLWDGSLLGGLKISGRDVAAASYDAREELAKARTRTRKGAVLWELMGLASKDIDRYGSTSFDTWCVEAAVRVGMWRKRLQEDKGSLFRLPVEDDWVNHSDDVLPEPILDALKLFKKLETKFRAFHIKCNEQMPEQATVLPEIPSKAPSRAATAETDQENATHHQQDLQEITQRDGTSEEMTPKMTVTHELQRDSIPQKFIQQNLIPKKSIPQLTIPQEAITHKPTPQRAATQMKKTDP